MLNEKKFVSIIAILTLMTITASAAKTNCELSTLK